MSPVVPSCTPMFLPVRSSTLKMYCFDSAAALAEAGVEAEVAVLPEAGSLAGGVEPQAARLRAITPARATEISFFIWIHSSLFPRSGGVVFWVVPVLCWGKPWV